MNEPVRSFPLTDNRVVLRMKNERIQQSIFRGILEKYHRKCRQRNESLNRKDIENYDYHDYIECCG